MQCIVYYLAGPNDTVGDDSVTKSISAPSKPVMLVFFVGGLSFIEVAALRFLSKSPDFPYSIVMGSTNMINGNSLIESIVHDPGVL